MKNMNDILKNVDEKIINNSKKDEARINEEAKCLVDLLFIAFEEHVKYFRANHPNGYDSAKREWTKTFIQVGISKERVQKGIKNLRKCEEVYSSLTPSEFLSLCAVTPHEIGAPDTKKAYLEACRLSHPCETVKNWSHVVVRYAAQKTGSHFLRTEPESKTYPVFEQNYTEACEMFADGRIMQTLEHDDGTKEYNTEMEKQRAVILDSHKDIKSASQAFKMMRNLL